MDKEPIEKPIIYSIVWRNQEDAEERKAMVDWYHNGFDDEKTQPFHLQTAREPSPWLRAQEPEETEEPGVVSCSDKCRAAQRRILSIAEEYADVDGAHHKQFALVQILREFNIEHDDPGIP